MSKNLFPLLFGNEAAYAQSIIDCPDGTKADASIGCVASPSSTVGSETNVAELILGFASGLMSVVIVVAIFLMMYGGIQYAVAAGDEERLQKAKRTMIWSIIGLIIALLARLGVGTIINYL